VRLFGGETILEITAELVTKIQRAPPVIFETGPFVR
jgi:hypothetical protein